MNRHERETHLTPEKEELKERLTRSGNPVVRKVTGMVYKEFWKLPKPDNPEGLALRYLL